MKKTDITTKDYLTHMDLHRVLGERIKETLDTSKTPEERAVSNEVSRFVLNLSNQMINNSNFILNAEKVLAENNDLDKSILKELIYGNQEV